MHVFFSFTTIWASFSRREHMWMSACVRFDSSGSYFSRVAFVVEPNIDIHAPVSNYAELWMNSRVFFSDDNRDGCHLLRTARCNWFCDARCGCKLSIEIAGTRVRLSGLPWGLLKLFSDFQTLLLRTVTSSKEPMWTRGQKLTLTAKLSPNFLSWSYF